MKFQKKIQLFFELDTWLAKNSKLKQQQKKIYYVTINKKDISHLTVYLDYNGPISAPVQKGEKIAELIVSKKDQIIKKLPLYATEDLKKLIFLKVC